MGGVPETLMNLLWILFINVGEMAGCVANIELALAFQPYHICEYVHIYVNIDHVAENIGAI